jgi:hypothetical protein
VGKDKPYEIVRVEADRLVVDYRLPGGKLERIISRRTGLVLEERVYAAARAGCYPAGSSRRLVIGAFFSDYACSNGVWYPCRVELEFFSPERQVLTRMKLSFSDVRINCPLEGNPFMLTVPRDVEVVRGQQCRGHGQGK